VVVCDLISVLSRPRATFNLGGSCEWSHTSGSVSGQYRGRGRAGFGVEIVGRRNRSRIAADGADIWGWL
jgi:hypothetical protein